MWGIVAGVVLFSILFVAVYGLYWLIKNRKRAGYEVQTDHKDYDVNIY